MNAMHATQRTKTTGCRPDSRGANLNPDPLPLPPDCLAQVVHLGADDVVDRFARAIDVFAHRIGDLLDRNRIDKLFAALSCRAVAAS
jgi:hypothetical protein